MDGKFSQLDELAADADLDEWSRDYFTSHEKIYRVVLNTVERFITMDETILEVGSVPCHLTAYLDERFDIVGIDIDPSRAAPLIDSCNLDVRECDIERDSFPLEDDEANFVVFTEVFEHLRVNPIHTLHEIQRVLSPDGTLLLTTPNLYYAKNIFDFVRGRGAMPPAYGEFSKIEQLGHMGHVREYSRHELVEFLENTGFDILSHEYRSFTKAETPQDKVAEFGGQIIPQLRRTHLITARPQR